MLTSMKVVANGGASLLIPLNDATTGYRIEDITGLGPVNATLVSSSYAQKDGAQYQTSRRELRNIVVRIGLDPNFTTDTVRDLRTRLSRFFMPKSAVSLAFYSDDYPPMHIRGVVESFETLLFAKDPTVSISIMCYDPDFTTGDPVQVLGYTTSGNDYFEINYAGDIATPFYLYMTLPRNLNDLWIHHENEDGGVESITFSLPEDKTLITGDQLTISTMPGSKGADLRRDNITVSMLYAISPYSKWITMHPGLNQFRVYTNGEPIPFWLAYFDKYGGL